MALRVNCYVVEKSRVAGTEDSLHPSVAGSIKNVEAGVALSLVLGRHTKAWI